VKFDWNEIQELYDSGLSYRGLIAKYGMSTRTLTRAKDRGDLKIRSRSDANKLYSKNNPHVHSIETKQKLSEIRVQALNHNAFYSKRTQYGNSVLDSTYELTVAQSLDENGIEWIRPKSLKWDDNGQIRRYIPDFYLPEYNVYLDPKNDYLIKKDQRKIALAAKYNNVRILILDRNNLTWERIKIVL
jgi:hypothetical protein